MIENHQLLRVRQLIDEADLQLSKGDDFGDGMSVSLAQDAVELFVRIVVRSRHVTVKDRATLEDMMNAVDDHSGSAVGNMPHRARIQDLNKARVGFKHTGVAPARLDATRLTRYGLEFLEVATPQYFGLQFREISLVDAITNVEVRETVKSAEEHERQGRWSEAVIEVAWAASTINETLSTLLRERPLLRIATADERERSIWQYISGVRDVALCGLLDFDVASMRRLKGMLPSVHKSMNGEKSQVVTRRAYGPDDTAFAIKCVVRLALAVQRRLGRE